MITTTQSQYTVQDYKLLEEGDLHQLINGELIALEPSPTYGHQSISIDIAVQIRNFLKENPVGEVLCAPMDIYFDNKNAFQPDIIYISNAKRHIIKEDGLHGAPDMIIEILSPSTCYYDTKIKKEIYEKHGVKELWIIDPADNKVMGFENINEKFQQFHVGYEKFTSKMLNLDISLKF